MCTLIRAAPYISIIYRICISHTVEYYYVDSPVTSAVGLSGEIDQDWLVDVMHLPTCLSGLGCVCVCDCIVLFTYYYISVNALYTYYYISVNPCMHISA